MIRFPRRRSDRRPIVRFNSAKERERFADSYLTADLILKLRNAIMCGMPLAQSQALVGVHSGLMKKWIMNGERVHKYLNENLDWPPGFQKHDELCYQLVDSIALATAARCAKYVAIVDKASKKDWHAAMKMLEKLVPEFGGGSQRVSIEASGPASRGGDPVRVQVYLPDNGRDPDPFEGAADG